MLKRRSSLHVVFLLITLILSYGCNPSQPRTNVPTVAATRHTATLSAPVATGTVLSSPTTAIPMATSTTAATTTVISTTPEVAPPPSGVTLKQANTCNLIDSRDLAHLFPPHNEIVANPPQTAAVTHPPFSTTPAAVAPASGIETTCMFFDFHQPGVQTGWMLQVTYRLDTPDPSAVTAWSQAWDAAKASAGQPVSGLGDDAFAVGANLYLRKGDTYLSFESIDTHLDEKSAAGVQQLLAYEKQLAAAALERMK